MVLGICCIGSAACCAGQTFCAGVCCCCTSLGISPKNFAKIAYVILNLFFVLISFLLMFTVQPIFEKVDFLKCNEQAGGDDSCFGTSAVLRMSFTLFLFHVMILLIISPRLTCSSAYHDGCWCCKFIWILAIYICVFFIPNDFYKIWAHIARVISGLFLILQCLLLIVAAFVLNDYLVGSYNQSGNRCQAILIISLTVLFDLGSIVFVVFQFIWFSDCAGAIVVICITILFIIAFNVLVILKLRKDASIFTSSMVSLYVVYLCWIACASIPDDDCNPFTLSTGNTIAQILVGLFFTFFTLIGITLMQQSDNSEQKMGNNTKNIIAENKEDADPSNIGQIESNGKQVSAEKAATFPITRPTIVFHVIMILASFYYAMLVTNWGDPTINDSKSNFYEANWASFWIKITAQWISMLLYIFSLIAPRICKGRDFI